MKRNIADEILKSLTNFAEKLEKGEEIEVTEVKREETPDGPLHTFEKRTIRKKKDDAV